MKKLETINLKRITEINAEEEFEYFCEKYGIEKDSEKLVARRAWNSALKLSYLILDVARDEMTKGQV